MAVDHVNGRYEQEEILRRLKDLEAANPSRNTADSLHPGSGINSVQLGPDADASGVRSVSVGVSGEASGYAAVNVGDSSEASGDYGVAAGYGAVASGIQSGAWGKSAQALHNFSVALGPGVGTTAIDQIMIGTSSHDVVVPGTFSNPSARRLKQNIIPAPSLTDIFPELTEWEYIDGNGRRRLGYIADDLIGTDAERFVTFDDEGRPSGIDYLSLLVVQNAQLNARLTALENGDAIG